MRIAPANSNHIVPIPRPPPHRLRICAVFLVLFFIVVIIVVVFHFFLSFTKTIELKDVETIEQYDFLVNEINIMKKLDHPNIARLDEPPFIFVLFMSSLLSVFFCVVTCMVP